MDEYHGLPLRAANFDEKEKNLDKNSTGKYVDLMILVHIHKQASMRNVKYQVL